VTWKTSPDLEVSRSHRQAVVSAAACSAGGGNGLLQQGMEVTVVHGLEG